jgi:hypothetical protein
MNNEAYKFQQPVNVATNKGIRTAASEALEASTAAREIWQQLAPVNAACVIFFCGSDYDYKLLAKSLTELFESVPVIGCTTAGEISHHGLTSGSISAFSLPADHFVVESMVFNNLAAFSAEQAFEAVKEKVNQLEQKAIAKGPGHSFVLSLLDGMSIREELVLRSLNEALNGLPLIGGSAGDNLNFGDTYVFYEGEFHNNAAVMILVNTDCPFRIINGHHFSASNEKLVVTQADPAKRIAMEINAEPAALEYCRIMGLSLDQLTPETFAMNPLAVHIGEHLFIRSIQQVNDDLSLTFFCAIDVGIVMSKVEDTGMIEHFNAMMLDVVDDIGQPQLTIGYDCIHRYIEAREKNITTELTTLYQRYNVMGFNTYGEQRDGLHMTHSFAGVAIGLPEVDIDD